LQDLLNRLQFVEKIFHKWTEIFHRARKIQSFIPFIMHKPAHQQHICYYLGLRCRVCHRLKHERMRKGDECPFNGILSMIFWIVSEALISAAS